MSKYQTIRAIRSEISRLNQVIDLKIIRGVSYARESRQHKFLVSQLSKLVSSRSSILTSPFGFLTHFMF